MHLLTILAFAVLLWEADDPGRWKMFGGSAVATCAGVGIVVAFLGAGWLVTRTGMRRLRADHRSASAVHQFQHRWMFFLRVVLLVAFGAAVLLTDWYSIFDFGSIHPALQIAGDLLTLTPYLLSAVMLWIVAYPLERTLRECEATVVPHDEPGLVWGFASYLSFHVRHYLLVVAVPMSLILFAAGLARGYAEQLRNLAFGLPFATDVVVGAVAVIVFVTAPVMLRYIWDTEPLETGELRTRLEALGERIGLQFREILVWKSGGMMINAAVMGVLQPFRFVMLSDALLETMSTKQIEAVFGHEAGHICRRHIPLFLIFAFVGWLATVAMMEILARAAIMWGLQESQALMLVQIWGVVSTVLIWGLGFGALSRGFELQADLFGARCVTSNDKTCRVPCSVHMDPPIAASPDRVCAEGAEVFASALDRVALLNGIPHEEWSWRHSSISNRMRFLASTASDPNRAQWFERRMRLIGRGMLVVAVLGVVSGAVYWRIVSVPAILQLQTGSQTSLLTGDESRTYDEISVYAEMTLRE